ncbi:MAG: TetR/AcrR family transcriptional regulator [Oceanococcus sp.]|nr:MAG: TetR/AcrR family transcriptional regulator [Oceanococcus sp.]
MPSRSPHSPRKTPVHRRSKVTVEAILEAAAHLLEHAGYARLTTNHIADKAGVSIGSLYQYFPNKDAICHALAERHFQRLQDEYLRVLEASVAFPVETQVRNLVATTLHAVRDNAVYSAKLYAELEQFGGLAPMRACRQAIAEALDQRVGMLPQHFRPANPRMVASIVVTAVSQLIGEAALSNPDWLDDPEYEEQICQLIFGYYQRLGFIAGH